MALLGALDALLNNRSYRLDEDDDDEDETLEGILNVNTQRRDGDDDEVYRGVGQCAEDNAQHIALTAGHVDAREDNSRDSVHFIALTGGGRSHVADLAGLNNTGHADHKTGDDEHGHLDPGGVDTGQTCALFIGADSVNTLAVLGVVGDDDEKDDHQHEHESNIRDGERADSELACTKLHAQELIVAVAAHHCELAGG